MNLCQIKTLGLVFLVFTTLLQGQTLEKVIVNAKTKQTMENTPGVSTVITAQDIKNMNATTLKDVLVQTAGISVGVNGSSLQGRQNISIRGAQSKYTLILIDGERVSNTDALIEHSNFEYSWVPLNSIEKIEILKGPMSSIYGSEALGGVVNIITKKSNKKTYGNILVSGGHNSGDGGNERGFSYNMGGKINKNINLFLSLEKKQVKPVFSSKNSKEPIREGKDINNILLKTKINIDDTQNINLSYTRGKEDRDGSVWGPLFEKYYELQREKHSFGYVKNFSDITMKLKYYKSTYKSTFNQTKIPYNHTLEDDIFHSEAIIDSFEKHFITTGFEYKKENYSKHYKNNLKDPFSNKALGKSFFIEDEISLNDNFLLTLGTRYDTYGKFKGELSPKANIIYNLDENNKFKFSYGHGFKPPTLTQSSSNYNTVHMGTSIIKGNNKLKPETSNSFEFGYEYYKNMISFKSNIFTTQMNNLIDTKIISTKVFSPRFKQYTYQYNNVASASMKGIELEYNQKELLPNMDLAINYDYLKTKDKNSNKELSFRPKQNLKMKLLYPLPYKMKSNISLRYTGKQKDDDDKYLGGYTTYSLQLSKQLKKSVLLSFGIDNVTNKVLEDSSYYNIKGRLVYVKLRYDF